MLVAEGFLSRPDGRDKKPGRDAKSPNKYAAGHDVTTEMRIFDCICITLLHKVSRRAPRNEKPPVLTRLVTGLHPVRGIRSAFIRAISGRKGVVVAVGVLVANG